MTSLGCHSNTCARCRPQPLGGAAKTLARTPAPTQEVVTGFARMSPAHKPRDPRCPLNPGVFGQEGVCAGELSELLKAVSGPRASGGTASSRQAGLADSQRVPAWENRAETPGIGETPDPGSRGQCDLSKAAGSGKVLPDSSSFPQCQAGKALCVCDAGGN